MKNSHIEWTDHTFNPWIGCTKVDELCRNCYAEARDLRFAGGIHWGPGAPRQRTKTWDQPSRWNLEMEKSEYQEICGVMTKPRPRVFCASLADWLDDEIPLEWLADLLELIHACPNLDWQLLTKRPENWRDLVSGALEILGTRESPAFVFVDEWLSGHVPPPRNIWLGTSVGDQRSADTRIPELLKIPARVRFLSCEPMLGPVSLGGFDGTSYRSWLDPVEKAHCGIHWVICGGESGSGARPFHPEWARSLRDQCAAAGVAFFFKQWGEWIPVSQSIAGQKPGPSDLFPDAKSTVIQLDGREEFAFPPGAMTCLKIGKLRSGRLLDGQEHNAFPSIP